MTEVLCLGAYARQSKASQIGTMTKGVGTGDAYWGSFEKGFTKVSRTEFEEDFMALLTHSDHGLGIAYDPENVIIGGESSIAKGIVGWLTQELAAKTLRFAQFEDFLLFCDARAAFEIVKDGGLRSPEGCGYTTMTMRISEKPRQNAA